MLDSEHEAEALKRTDAVGNEPRISPLRWDVEVTRGLDRVDG